MPLSISHHSSCHRISGCTEQNSRRSQILAIANVRVAHAHMFASRWQYQTSREYTVVTVEGRILPLLFGSQQ